MISKFSILTKKVVNCDIFGQKLRCSSSISNKLSVNVQLSSRIQTHWEFFCVIPRTFCTKIHVWIEGRNKKRIFYGRADRKRLPPLSRSAFCEFFGAFFILYYDSMCSETDFTQGKSHFRPTSRIPNPSLLFAAALSQNLRIAV